MDTFTLCRLACSDMQVKKGFGGVFSSDCLPKNKGLFKSFIVNLDPQFLGGSHWIAIFFKNDKAYYFDSYGHYPQNPAIYTFLMQNASDIRYNSVGFQNFNSLTCGHFCLYFLNRMSRNLDMCELNHIDRGKNEHFIKAFVSANFKLSECCVAFRGIQTCRALLNVMRSK